jgi:hypothetical protein
MMARERDWSGENHQVVNRNATHPQPILTRLLPRNPDVRSTRIVPHGTAAIRRQRLHQVVAQMMKIRGVASGGQSRAVQFPIGGQEFGPVVGDFK